MILNDIVIVRGGGDLASGVVQKLYRCGFKVLILEIQNPSSIRRRTSFSEAIYNRQVKIEGITAVYVNCLDHINEAWSNKNIPVIIDPNGKYISLLQPNIVVDAIVAKKNLGMKIDLAPITIALGPGFTAGKDVDIVIETSRGHDLGRLIFKGEAKKDTGIPGVIGGYSIERVVYSPCNGKIENLKDIGETVDKDEIIAYVGDKPVITEISGLLRGIIKNGSLVTAGLKIADIDPRITEKDNCYTISDKSRNIAGGVLEAIYYMTTID
ncbi:EF2563 family selenium-dependent molybdenum hydroxylase system protein [Alkalibaculum sp. M08DMB]|uniref:EF2563 family selenium-dependent molybdenum hydroxylase system protein n=1 Tax=Alkalibaculum sporogenes TaxID=2655001 RepID=A0A6A7K9Q4_9FIRM|nr:selenium-dependent molybdenum cofactor biosynthesis protein YqeB [Alkalibaculum sporogenes]MPW26095.1 EF2563 family selenium-dependent molybdenum hydroxylase system protein [Alkalibaculum sporogenes]